MLDDVANLGQTNLEMTKVRSPHRRTSPQHPCVQLGPPKAHGRVHQANAAAAAAATEDTENQLADGRLGMSTTAPACQVGGMQKCALPLQRAPARPHTASPTAATSYAAASMGPTCIPVPHSVPAAATAGAVAGAEVPPPAVPHGTGRHGYPVSAPHQAAQGPVAPHDLVALYPGHVTAAAPSLQRFPPVEPPSPQPLPGPQPMDITPHHTPKPQHQLGAQCLPQHGASSGRGDTALAVTSTAAGLAPPFGTAAPQAALLCASWDAGGCRGNEGDEQQQEEEEEEEEEARLWDEGGPRGTCGGAYDSDEDWMMTQQQQEGTAAYGRGSRAGSAREYGSLWEDAEEEQQEREQEQGQERDCVLGGTGGGGGVGLGEQEDCREEGHQVEVNMADGEEQVGPQEGWGEAGAPALAVACGGMRAAAPVVAEAVEVPCVQTHVAGVGDAPPRSRSRSRGRARVRSGRAVAVSTLFGWDAQVEEQEKRPGLHGQQQLQQRIQQQQVQQRVQQRQVHPCGGTSPVCDAPLPPPLPAHTAPGAPADTGYTARTEQERQQQQPAAAAAAGPGATAAAAPAPGMPAPPSNASMLGSAPGCAAPHGAAPAAAAPAARCPADDANPLASEECSPDFWDNVPAVYEVYEVFPFQRNALDFADWANTAPPDALRRLARETATTNFPSFAQRWTVLERHMRQHPPSQQPPHLQPTTGTAEAAGEEGAATAGTGGGGGGGAGCGGGQRGAAVGPPEPVRVFVEEYAGRNGFTRHFVATTYKAVWQRNLRLGSLQRHWYEVLRGDRPCHMYFDLEYSRAANPGADGNALVAELLQQLAVLLRSSWGVEMQPRHVLELRSLTPPEAAAAGSRGGSGGGGAGGGGGGGAGGGGGCVLEDKWSRHLVVRLPGVALASNAVAGAIVQRLGPGLRAAGLDMLKAGEPPGGATACVVDPAVYSRNRHFRMAHSCKAGKAAVLVPTEGRFMLQQQQGQGQQGHQGQGHQGQQGEGQLPPQSEQQECAVRAGRDGAGRGGGAGGAAGERRSRLRAQHRVFLASLVANVHPGARLLQLPAGFLDGVQPLRGLAAVARAAGAGGGGGGPPPLGGGAVFGGGGGGGGSSLLELNISHPATHRPVKLSWCEEPLALRTAQEAAALRPAAAAAAAAAAGVPGQPAHPQAQPPPRPSLSGGSAGGAAGDAGGPGLGVQQGAVDVGQGAAEAEAEAAERAVRAAAVRACGSALQGVALAAVPFVEIMATSRAGGATAHVRSMAYCGEGATVSYGMIGPGSHVCDRVGRAHRSNHVYFLLDFLRGQYCQKCYDPDCAGWRSDWNAMPPETWLGPDGTPRLTLTVPGTPAPANSTSHATRTTSNTTGGGTAAAAAATAATATSGHTAAGPGVTAGGGQGAYAPGAAAAVCPSSGTANTPAGVGVGNTTAVAAAGAGGHAVASTDGARGACGAGYGANLQGGGGVHVAGAGTCSGRHAATRVTPSGNSPLVPLTEPLCQPGGTAAAAAAAPGMAAAADRPIAAPSQGPPHTAAMQPVHHQGNTGAQVGAAAAQQQRPRGPSAAAAAAAATVTAAALAPTLPPPRVERPAGTVVFMPTRRRPVGQVPGHANAPAAAAALAPGPGGPGAHAQQPAHQPLLHHHHQQHQQHFQAAHLQQQPLHLHQQPAQAHHRYGGASAVGQPQGGHVPVPVPQQHHHHHHHQSQHHAPAAAAAQAPLPADQLRQQQELHQRPQPADSIQEQLPLLQQLLQHRSGQVASGQGLAAGAPSAPPAGPGGAGRKSEAAAGRERSRSRGRSRGRGAREGVAVADLFNMGP